MKPILISCTVAALMALNAGPVWANDFDKAIAQAREGVEKSSFAQALEAARHARALNPSDFRSYYYEAMAQVGLGNKAEARTAVKAAQERAPASANDALQKLAQMAAAPAATSSEAAQTSKAVIISCTFSGRKFRYFGLKEEAENIAESTKILRLEDGNFQVWWTKENKWSEYLWCTRTKSETTTEMRSDGRKETRTAERVECRATADRFSAKEVYKYEFDSPSKHGTPDITERTDILVINRLTGTYSSEATVFWSDNGRPWREEYSGVCRPAKDPAAATPRF